MPSGTTSRRAAPRTRYEQLRRRIVDIADALEDPQTIPAIAEQVELIQAVQADEWWG